MDRLLSLGKVVIVGACFAALVIGLAVVVYILVVMPLPQTTIYTH